ncbi:helix-turn-helix domain-containing protein [Paenibacillus arenilitoris]|uniref:AraC family transcriptional regulator n=1 Tax=Paenibacillus arenilitoris TaxID=2772299 RepID=A0A927CFG7_9BACL|nr:helix-turn-helix domain-containing protein [Paenibacillus arenilitoris]MBD2867104.1 AraC family transcriptional regulator [Paenibacillus arenilitoris]
MTADVKKRKRRIIAAFSASYIVLLVIPIIVSLIVYNRTVAIVKDEVVRSNMLMLEQAKSILDRRMSEIDSMVRQIASDPNIASFQFMTDPFEDANTFKTWYTAEHLYDYSTSNNFILEYFVLYQNSGVVLGHQNVYKTEQFFNQVFRYKDMDPADMELLILGAKHSNEVLPAMDSIYRNRTVPVVSYVQSLDSASSPSASILVLIDSREMVKLLEGFDFTSGGTAYIMDAEGQMIASVANSVDSSRIQHAFTGMQGEIEPSRETGGMLTTYTKLESKDWYFAVAQSPDIVYQKVNKIRSILVGLSVLLLSVLVLYCFFAYRQSKPIRKLLLRIMERSESEAYGALKPYALIERNYSRLEDDRQRLQQSIQEQLPLIRNSFLQRLLKGDYSTESELLALRRHSGAELSGANYAVVVIRLQSYDGELTPDILQELEIRKVMVKDVLDLPAYADCVWHDAEQDTINIIVPLHDRDAGESRKQLESLLVILQEHLHFKHGISPVFAIGGIYPALSEVSRSYVEARRALAWGQREIGTKMVWFDRLPQEKSFYYYPPDSELRLIHLTKLGAMDEADALLEHIYRINQEMNLSSDMIKFLHYEMWGTLVKITQDADLEVTDGMFALRFSRHKAGDMELDSLLKELREAYALIGKAIHMRKDNQRSGLIEQIVAYIDSNFRRQDFSLTELADRFNMSDSYLSQFFKDQIGINYFEYVESARMKCAKDLLMRTDMPINEIAAQIGYSLSSTFCRAFKRINGVSASNFRRLNT